MSSLKNGRKLTLVLTLAATVNFWSPSGIASTDDIKYRSMVKALSNEKNYLGALSPQNINTWSFVQPIKVYVHSGSDVSGYTPKYLANLNYALKAWTEASNGQINFTLVNKPVADGIDISWKARPKKTLMNSENGITSIVPGMVGIKRSTIELYIFPKINQSDSALDEMFICLHELGHALGIQGHSPIGTDIMCARYNISSGRVGPIKLTERDKNTILAILKLGPRKSDTDGDNANLIRTAARDINERHFEKAIKELEECLRLNPSDKLVALNLEIAYDNYAVQFYTRKKYAEAAPIFERLLTLPTLKSKTRLQVLEAYAFCLEQTGNELEAAKTRATIQQLSSTLPKMTGETNGNRTAGTRAKLKAK